MHFFNGDVELERDRFRRHARVVQVDYRRLLAFGHDQPWCASGILLFSSAIINQQRQ
jgi:hypothetical protein